MPKIAKKLTWNISDLAKAMKLSKKVTEDYFKDGRRASPLLERRLARVLKWKLTDSERTGWDLKDWRGGKWEVRCITKEGVYFNPSMNVGGSRGYNKTAYSNKLKVLKGYILCDIVTFPKVTFWKVPKKAVREWKRKKKLRKDTKITRTNVLKLLN